MTYIALSAALVVSLGLAYGALRKPLISSLDLYSASIRDTLESAHAERDDIIADLLISEQKAQGKDREIHKIKQQFSKKIDATISNAEMQNLRLEERHEKDVEKSCQYIRDCYRSKFEDEFLRSLQMRIKSLSEARIKELDHAILSFAIRDIDQDYNKR